MNDLTKLDNKELKKLNESIQNGLKLIDDIVLKNYISSLEELEIIPLDEDLKRDNINRIRLLNITKMVYNKDEASTHKFASIFNAVASTNSSLITIINSDGKDTKFYLGVRTLIENNSPATPFEVLGKSIQGQFPGIKLENLKNKINCEINVVKDVNLPNHLIITHNLTDFPRLENERKFLDESNEEYREKSKIIIKVTMNSDMEEDENVNLIINMKIFFLLAVYSGIRNDIYFMNLNKNLKELYFGVVTDIHYMLNLKENFLLQDLSFIQENDYFEHLIEKTENYFLSLSLNKREDIKKINLGTVKEPQEYLDTFKNALIDGYFYYKNNYDKYIEDSAINKDLNDIINILTENFDLDEIFI